MTNLVRVSVAIDTDPLAELVALLERNGDAFE
jgi:hypothetical protein